MKPPRWSREEWDEATIRVLGRDGDRCASCGRALRGDADRHHRMRRRAGGDRIENVVLMHHRCHMDVHAHPDQARDRGLIVPTWGVLTETPIRLPGIGWCLLDAEGTRSPSEPLGT